MKPTARRIVCATDFSDNARTAADVAVAIALRLCARVLLVHVADQQHTSLEGTKEFHSLLAEARKGLRKEAQRLRGQGATVEELVLHGYWAGFAICDLVEKDPPLMAVVASVSKSAFDRWQLGSVSEHLAQHSAVPTLVVRAPAGLLAWARQERHLRALVAVDLTVSSDAALAMVRHLRKVGACAVTAAHVNLPSEQPGPARSVLSRPHAAAQARRQLLRALRRKARALIDGAVDVRLETEGGRPDAALVDLAREADADLLIVGTHQRHGVKRVAHASVSRGVLRHAPINVLCVPVSVALAHGVGHHPRVERVLVATDLSPSGDRAIPWAYAAASAGGMVKLVHVVRPWEPPSPLVPRYERKRETRSAHHARVEKARDQLAALVPPEAAVRGIETQVEIVDDRDPVHGIEAAAGRFDPDLICLSTGESAAAAPARFGPIVRKIIAQHAEPVLLVKPERP